MKIELCNDIELLASLNALLYEDENNDKIFSHSELKERVTNMLQKGCTAYLFTEDNTVLGYAIVNETLNPPYLHHFFICREYRRNKMGTKAFQALINHLNAETMDLDVFCWNERGKAFWKSLGFTERCYIMRYKK